MNREKDFIAITISVTGEASGKFWKCAANIYVVLSEKKVWNTYYIDETFVQGIYALYKIIMGITYTLLWY